MNRETERYRDKRQRNRVTEILIKRQNKEPKAEKHFGFKRIRFA